MNISETTYGNPISVRSAVVRNEGRNGAGNPMPGDILEGTVLEAGSSVKVALKNGQSEREVCFPEGSITNTYKGDIRKFEVVEATSERLVLKDLGSIVADTLNQGLKFTTVNTGLSAMVEDFSETMGTTEKEDEDNIERLSDEDYSELRAEGFDIEEFKAERLDRAIARIKVSRRIAQENIERESADIAEERKKLVRRAAEAATDGSGLQALIAERLINADLPVTRENIAEIATAVKMGAGAAAMTDASYAFILKNELEPTAGNIYRSVYAGSMKHINVDSETWEALREDALKITDSAEAELSDARWMIEYDIPLTRENLLYKKELQKLHTDYAAGDAVGVRTDAESSAGDAPVLRTIEAAIDAIYRGEPAERALLIDRSAEAATELRNSTDPVIREINSRLKLEESRLRMTYEGYASLRALGIDPGTAETERIVEGLRELEREAYRQLMQELGLGEENGTQAIDTEETISLAQETADAVYQIGRAPESLLAQTYESRHIITVTGLADAAEQMSGDPAHRGEAAVSRAIGRYEESATEVRPDLGDSMRKAFKGIDSLLSENAMDLTEANRRAVRILGHNSMEITPENIEGMKFYDSRVTGLVEHMKPAIVLAMIKEGINPLTEDIDTLSDKVDRLLEEQGYSSEEKYAEFLVRMEESGAVSESEKEAYIGIYRLLYQVSKNDGAALGAAIRSGRKLTLGNLLTEVRSAADSGIDARINDASSVRVTSYRDSITSQIDEAYRYHKNIVRDICDVTAAESWSDALQGTSAEEISVEELLEKLTIADNHMGDHTHQATAVRNVMMDSGAVRNYLRSFGLDDSVNHVLAAGRSERVGMASGDELMSWLQDDGMLDTEYESRLESLERTAEQAFTQKLSAGAAGELTAQLSRYGLLREFAREKHYEFSVGPNGDARVSLTVVSGTETPGSVHIDLTNSVGHYRADLTVRPDETVNGSVACDSDAERAAAEEAFTAYGDDLKAAGYEAGSLRLITDRISDGRYMSRLGEIKRKASTGSTAAEHAEERSDTEVAATNGLYRVARMFLERFL